MWHIHNKFIKVLDDDSLSELGKPSVNPIYLSSFNRIRTRKNLENFGTLWESNYSAGASLRWVCTERVRDFDFWFW